MHLITVLAATALLFCCVSGSEANFPRQEDCSVMKYANRAQFLTLVRLVNIRGLVTAWPNLSPGKPLEGACVGVFTDEDSPKLLRALKVGTDGRFSFPNLTAGTYRFAASFPSFCPVAVRVQLRPGDERWYISVFMQGYGIDDCSDISLKRDSKQGLGVLVRATHSCVSYTAGFDQPR